MLDFLEIESRVTKKNVVDVYPVFKMYPKSNDLMIRGGDFYAIWNESKGLWTTDEDEALYLIDLSLKELFDKYKKDNLEQGVKYNLKNMQNSTSGSIDAWHKYCQKQKRDSYVMLDEKLIFQNTSPNREDYASKRLPYSLEKTNIDNYEKIMSTLYDPNERMKIEWSIGSVVSGDSKWLQKFLVFYGAAGTGKSTVLNIIQDLFDGYYSVFDARALGMPNNSFALEPFKTNPLVAIQHDGDLSKIEDNTRLNSLVSHEEMTVNEKFKSVYTNRFKAFLFMGTNKPVKITDAKSGLLRRLIDVSPNGNKLPFDVYNKCINGVKFELGGIATHCLQIYNNNKEYYDKYVPKSMMSASNDFYNFVLDSYHIFKAADGITLKQAWEMYKVYCEDTKVPYPLPQRQFKEELKNYFKEFDDKVYEDDNTIKNYYSGFKDDIFNMNDTEEESNIEDFYTVLEFKSQESLFDKECVDCLAQYANRNETPNQPWDTVKETLKDIDTSKIHYVKIPENHIVIDFDLKDKNGNKSFELNLEAASKWPLTYAELSKSGQGIHLHYIYTGDVTQLSRIYADSIEVKVFTGKSSLRRKLTKCNNSPIKTISSGLPMKGVRKVTNSNVIKSEKGLRNLILRNLNKEIHPGTKPSIDFIYKILEDAYERGMKYDITDMKNQIYAFAMGSTNQSEYCIKLVAKMHLKSDEASADVDSLVDEIIFWDVEVFPNLFILNWKIRGKNNPVVRMINPTPNEVEEILKYKLVGFNCRRYDNHIVYARLMGYTNEQLFNLSQRIINQEKNVFFGEAYNLSYTDIYDFASAGNKKSLKKLEIEMGIHHQELGLPWDQPVPEEKWILVAEYCDNDVYATEAAFDYLSADWTARQILADLAGMSVNDTTNALTTRIIFGSEKKPQGEFCYRDLSQPVKTIELHPDVIDFLEEACPVMMSMPHGDKNSILPYFPGYKYEFGKSTYRGEEVGEGGYVYSEPGMYTNVALLDIVSMHPNSLISECNFGPRYTKAFRDIVKGRVSIKHESWDEVNNMLDGKLTPYIEKVMNGEMKSKDLANALKTAINSVYGLTSASFDNPFRDIRNKDNIVAKRGALFMIDLKHEVQKRGFTVAHIKTDSIKIPNATQEIIEFIMEFGQKYGYTFEHEATYEKMCLVNDAVYIAKYKDGNWTATGTQFQVPYVFKTLFSKEPINFDDMCETKSVTSALYLDFNEQLPDVSYEEKELAKLEKQRKDLQKIGQDMPDDSFNELQQVISKGHDYSFIGKVGNFCPILPGHGGGLLVREKDGKYYSATGAKGYRWLESEMVRNTSEEYIDKSYYTNLVDDAIKEISKYGDFEWFSSNDVDNFEMLKKDKVPCGDKKYETCFECSKFDSGECKLGYNLNSYILNN